MAGAVWAASDEADAINASAAATEMRMASAAQLVDFGLERRELGLERIDFAVARLRVRRLAGEGLGRASKNAHVALGNVGEDIAAECVAGRALVALEGVHRSLEILRHEILHRIAVKADQLLEEIERKHGASPRFLVDDDLGQDVARDVLPGLGVDDFELPAFADHLRKPVESDVC